MNENNEMNMSDIRNSLCAYINAEMRNRPHNDKIEISGCAAPHIADMYSVLKAFEVVAANCLPMMTSADDLKTALKHSIDLMDFNGVTTEEETNVTR